MSIDELQNRLIQDIQDIDDENFLKAIYTIVHSRTKVYKLSPEEEKRIQIGLEQIKYGEVKSNDDVINELSQWLKEK